MSSNLAKALTAHQSGDYATTAALLKNCLTETPADPEALRHLAILAGETGHLEEAELWLRRLIMLIPDDGDGWQRLARVSRAMASSDSTTLAIRCLALMPADRECWRNLALIRYQADHYSPAAAAFGRARLCGGDASVALLESEMLERAGNPESAAQTLSTALSEGPLTGPLCLRYAQLLFSLAQHETAWLWACRALALRPAHAGTIELVIALLRHQSRVDLLERYRLRCRRLLS